MLLAQLARRGQLVASQQLCGAQHVIVQVERLPEGNRKVVSVQEIQGMDDTTVLLQEVFVYEPRITERFKERDVELPLHVFRRG